jgi:hypothetical protein
MKQWFDRLSKSRKQDLIVSIVAFILIFIAYLISR